MCACVCVYVSLAGIIVELTTTTTTTCIVSHYIIFTMVMRLK